ncbi:MAG: hypothetical protein IKG82_07920 [Oscillospiraceae bacterium]|nr:hypothetical protein [Oscillospiraceae bacterium]
MPQQHSMPKPPPARYVKPQISARRKRLKAVNIGCGAAIPFLAIILGTTLNITLIAALPVLIFGLCVIPFFFKLNDDTGSCRIPLLISRVIGIGLLAVTLLAPPVCLGFSRTPLLYPVKRLVYAKGVKSYQNIGAFCEHRCLLPEKLPAVHEDYRFYTDQALHGPDGPYPDAYLVFHTDTETLKQYAAKLEASREIKRQRYELTEDDLNNLDYFTDEQDRLAFKYRRLFNIPEEITGRMLRNSGITDDLSDADYYVPADKTNLGSGVLINYETGLFLAWD